MSTDKNNQIDSEESQNGAEEESSVDTVSVLKADYDKLNQTLGSLKRELKDLRKSREESETPKKEPAKESEFKADNSLIEKTFFKASGITDPDVMQLAKDIAKRTGETLDIVLEDEIFKSRAERIITSKANELAADTKNNRSNSTTGRNSVEYWLAKGEHPPKELGKELAVKYVQAKRNQGANTKMFYND